MTNKVLVRSIKGFTLIELLIVVAIIAILAAIAIPNFLAAQVRAKVSKAKAEMRSMATAVEAYDVDNNVYPWNIQPPDDYMGSWSATGWVADYASLMTRTITTPIAYITSLPFDPFSPAKDPSAYGYPYGTQLRYMFYRQRNNMYNILRTDGGLPEVSSAVIWGMYSVGPDRTYALYDGSGYVYPYDLLVYDPSNGTVSDGNIWRVGP